MLKIIESPDPILNQVCEPCIPGDKSLKKLAKQMEKAMYANDGVGIAAPQVGVLKRIIVIDVSPEDVRDPLVLVNPEILELSGDPEIEDEGCLSCPGISVPIERQPWARVGFYDLDGERWEVEGDGLLARCLQHEIDHLYGHLFIEKATDLRKVGD